MVSSEHASMQRITEKSDVYSFGVVLLEVLTGRHPLDPTLPGGAYLVQWVRDHLHSKQDPMDILDSRLQGRPDSQVQEMLQTLAVSFLCISTQADDRPMMKDVVAMLEEIKQEEVKSETNLVKSGSAALSSSARSMVLQGSSKGSTALSSSARSMALQGSSNCSFAFSDDSV